MSLIKVPAAWRGWFGVLVAGFLLSLGMPVSAQESAALGGGDSHTCAVLTGGSMKCWGRQEQNQLAAGYYLYSTGTPVDVVGISDAVAVTGGYQFTCVLLADRRIKCFGYNRWGQLGTGPEVSCTGAGDCTVVVGINDAVDVAAGGSHTCAVSSGGSVRCWGLNYHGQLGLGSDGAVETNVPLLVPGISDAFAVAAGTSHSCALVGDGAVKCWGRNQYGQLGLGTASGDPGVMAPTDVPGITDGTAIVAGDAHTCVLHASGSVSCWGHEDHGALGIPEQVDQYLASPVLVSGVNDAVAVSAGDYHTCVLHAGGTVSCSGNNWLGQIGDGTNRNSRFTPAAVLNVANADLLFAGGNHTCARVATDPVNVKCWGSGNFGQIGNGEVGGVNERPTADHVVGSPFDIIFGGAGGSFEGQP